MREKRKWLCGSLTVEAACVMAIVLLCLCVMIRQAGNLRDETVGAMGLHEAVEKGRHEKGVEPERIASDVQRYMGAPMTFSGYRLHVSSHGKRIQGKGQGGGWSHEIEGKRFRPETFLRKITLIEGLGEKDED